MRLSVLRRSLPLAVAGTLVCGPIAAQSLEGTGAIATGLLLRQLDGVKRVLMIGAHPDDEDTSLLTTLARGWGAETAYLSLTRGDGGQNLIGSELFEGLGVVRTGELVAARALDGGGQFFTRAFDYGFSKSADEALTFWPSNDLLGDVVWAIRTFRPHVVVSVFSGTPRDGHGQHQAAGIMAREAFAAAGDPGRFPEQLSRGVEAWAPAKLYESARGGFGGRGGGPPADALLIPTGGLDPLLGRSLFQLSMESRSQHRSQDMGAPQPPGPSNTGVRLVESRVGGSPRGGIFEGVDTTLAGLVGPLPATVAAVTRSHLEAYRTSLGRARAGFGLETSAIVADLAEALDQLQQASEATRGAQDRELRIVLGRKTELATRAFMAAAGIQFDVRGVDDLIVPGQTVRVTATLWNASPLTLSGIDVGLAAPSGWGVSETSSTGLAPGGTVAPGTLVTWAYDVTLPLNADLSRLYFLRESRDGAWYRWPDEPTLWGLPRDPASVVGSLSFMPASTASGSTPELRSSEPWRFVGVDPAQGEYERVVLVVPEVSVTVSPGGIVWPAASSGGQTVSVVLRSEAAGGASGSLTVRAPSGWRATPAERSFELPDAGTERTLTFQIEPTGSLASGEHAFAFTATTANGRTFSESYALIDYDHIERAALFSSAEARVTVVPVTVPEGLRVGYIMGSGDDGPEAVRQLGVEVEVLGEDRVREGAFEGFDAIVLGVRAYETRADLRAAAEQLLDYARGGGTVVAQYNRGPFGGLAPRPFQTGRGSPRVSDETAPVRMLDPEAPIFTTPNRIGAADFDGWVQERGLYFASEWDDAYVPLLELNDPGEDPRRGSLLVTSVGDGVFVFTALSFFRQWSARVPGAYRLFANLISVDPAAWRAYEALR